MIRRMLMGTAAALIFAALLYLLWQHLPDVFTRDAGAAVALATPLAPTAPQANPPVFFEQHCSSCHDAQTKKGGLDLAALKADAANPDDFARWVKVYDRIESGEMPPKKRPRPGAEETASAKKWLVEMLVKAERAKAGTGEGDDGRTVLRRLTRAEYENTVRDLFDLPGIALQVDLPADGSAHGFDNNSDALDISHVNMTRYIEAADRALDMAIATRPKAPTVAKLRLSLGNTYIVSHILLQGDGVLLRNKQPDPEFPPPNGEPHIDQGLHERMGVFRRGSSVGLFRHEDEAFHPAFLEFAAIYPGQYKLRASLWSFQWDKGKVLPARGTEAARFSVIHLTGDGRGGDHPSTVLAYYDAPSLQETVHDFVTWLNPRDTLGFNAASLAPGAQTRGKNGTMGFTGPGIACDFLELEGPLNEVWPPKSHRLLFGELPLVEFVAAKNPSTRAPKRRALRQEVGGRNQPDYEPGIWTVHSEKPLEDADRLLARFLPKAFRRPVAVATRKQYLAKFEERLKAGDCFETALRWVYRAALCSPQFLYHVEPAGKLDDHALACRLSYLLWKSLPDDELTQLAQSGRLLDRDSLHAQTARLLADPKSQRFIEDFLGQWLKLRLIAANDADRKLYPEFSPYLQDSMVAETRAYFRELLAKDLDATHLVKSSFAMLNEKLAVHYGIQGVSGSQMRRVALPAGSPRGPFLTQAAVLKVTANGTTTSPVPRGAFVMDRLLGRPPEPPPPNIPAIEPDVRGAKTIREQLDLHRADTSCASCHAKIDPPGFALESFDVIGGYRTRYRSIGAGDPAPRGSIDPFIGIGFKLGPAVDASGVLPDGRTFHGINEFQDLLAADSSALLTNLARQLAIYGAGRDVSFSDRQDIAGIVAATQKHGGGVRTLLHELVESRLFQTR